MINHMITPSIWQRIRLSAILLKSRTGTLKLLSEHHIVAIFCSHMNSGGVLSDVSYSSDRQLLNSLMINFTVFIP